MGNRWVAVLDRWLHEVAGLCGAGHCTFVLARLGLLHLGCNREVAALLRWLLTQPSSREGDQAVLPSSAPYPPNSMKCSVPYPITPTLSSVI